MFVLYVGWCCYLLLVGVADFSYCFCVVLLAILCVIEFVDVVGGFCGLNLQFLESLHARFLFQSV